MLYVLTGLLKELFPLPSVFVAFMQFLHAEIYSSVIWGTESSNAAARIGRRELLQGSAIKWSCCNMLQLEKGEILDAQQQTMSGRLSISKCLASLMCYIQLHENYIFMCMVFHIHFSFVFKNNVPKNRDKT